MSEPTNTGEETPVDELNPDGVGGTMGEDNTFEPEEDPAAEVDTK